MEKIQIIAFIVAGITIAIDGLVVALFFLLGGPDGNKSIFLLLLGIGALAYVSMCLWMLHKAKKRTTWAISLILIMTPALYWPLRVLGIFSVVWGVGMVAVVILTLTDIQRTTSENQYSLNKQRNSDSGADAPPPVR